MNFPISLFLNMKCAMRVSLIVITLFAVGHANATTHTTDQQNDTKGLFVAVGVIDNKNAYSSDGINWHLTNDMPFEYRSWTSVAYGNNLFVTVTDYGAAYSSDGINWRGSLSKPDCAAVNTSCDSLSLGNWNAVAYGNGSFVAISADGGISHSSNGRDWRQCDLPTKETWGTVTFGNGKFLVLTSMNDIGLFSTDGIRWLPMPNPIIPGHQYTFSGPITFGDNKFVIVNGYGSASSCDGTHWQVSQSPTLPGCSSVAYGKGTFVAVANNAAAYSHDGINWDTSTKMPQMNRNQRLHVAYGKNIFVAVANGGSANSHSPINTTPCIYSYNGIVWTAAKTDTSLPVNWNSVAYGEVR